MDKSKNHKGGGQNQHFLPLDSAEEILTHTLGILGIAKLLQETTLADRQSQLVTSIEDLSNLIRDVLRTNQQSS